MCIQKKSLLLNLRKPCGEQVPFWEQKLWWVGMVVFTAAQAPNLLAMYYLSLTIIAPLGAMSLIANIFNAHIFLDEPVDGKDVAATFIIVAGCVMAVVFGPLDSAPVTVPQVVSNLEEPGFLVLFALFVSVVAVLAVYAERNAPPPVPADEDVQESDPLEAGEAEPLQDEAPAAEDPFSLTTLVFPVLAGLISAASLLAARLLSTSLANFAVSSRCALLYVSTTAVVLGSVGNIKYLNMALERFDVRHVIPVYFSIQVLFSICLNIVFFKETDFFFHPDHRINLLLFPIGVALTFSGVYVLMQPSEVVEAIESSEAIEDSLLTTRTKIHEDTIAGRRVSLVLKAPRVLADGVSSKSAPFVVPADFVVYGGSSSGLDTIAEEGDEHRSRSFSSRRVSRTRTMRSASILRPTHSYGSIPEPTRQRFISLQDNRTSSI